MPSSESIPTPSGTPWKLNADGSISRISWDSVPGGLKDIPLSGDPLYDAEWKRFGFVYGVVPADAASVVIDGGFAQAFVVDGDIPRTPDEAPPRVELPPDTLETRRAYIRSLRSTPGERLGNPFLDGEWTLVRREPDEYVILARIENGTTHRMTARRRDDAIPLGATVVVDEFSYIAPAPHRGRRYGRPNDGTERTIVVHDPRNLRFPPERDERIDGN